MEAESSAAALIFLKACSDCAEPVSVTSRRSCAPFPGEAADFDVVLRLVVFMNCSLTVPGRTSERDGLNANRMLQCLLARSYAVPMSAQCGGPVPLQFVIEKIYRKDLSRPGQMT